MATRQENYGDGDRTRMAIIETDIKHIKQTLDRFQKSLDESSKQISETNNKLNVFIDSANKLYATKIELDSLKSDIIRDKKNSSEWIRNVIPWTIAGILLILTIVNFFINFGGLH